MNVPPKIEENDQLLLGWIDEALKSGLALLKREYTYSGIGPAIDYLNGNQASLRQSSLSRVTFNRLRKIAYEVVSSMTDVRPIWDYQTSNPKFKKQSEILNTIVRNWWRNNYCDRRLQDCLMYSVAGGSGYLKVEWNPFLPGGGNIDLIALDPRDVIPILPSYNTSVQQWQGVAHRRTVSLMALRQRYPEKFYKYKASSKQWFDSKTQSGAQSGLSNLNVLSPTLQTLFSKSSPSMGTADVDLVFVYIKDDSMNTGVDPVVMGRPDTNWCYKVYPLGSIHPITNKVVQEEEARLYPRGRLIVCTPECILEDIPNPYWHGMFPIVKFTLDPQPWSILGSSLVMDGMSMQDSLNEILRGVEDCVKQWLRRTVIVDKNAISQSKLRTFDPRVAGQKVSLNPTAGEGMKLADGPVLPPYIMEYVRLLLDSLDDNSGVKGLRELAQLKQMPNSDTVDKFMDAQSPILRLRGRSLEQSLAEMAEMVKAMIFQYYDAPRRIAILGPDGITHEDFDYDPRNMIPAMQPSDAFYRPEYDWRLSRLDRGVKHNKNFTFTVAPNSFLSATQTQQKMFLLQLARFPGAPLIDPWTLLEAFDVPNRGEEPKGSVFDRIVTAQKLGILPPTQLQLMQMQSQQQMGGAPPEAGGPPPGRPPSGQSPPQLASRTGEDGIPRQTVTEAG